MHGTAHHTSGGLQKKDLKHNRKTGRIVSRRVSKKAKTQYRKNGLVPASRAEMARLRRMAGKGKKRSRSRSPVRRRSPRSHDAWWM